MMVTGPWHYCSALKQRVLWKTLYKYNCIIIILIYEGLWEKEVHIIILLKYVYVLHINITSKNLLLKFLTLNENVL